MTHSSSTSTAFIGGSQARGNATTLANAANGYHQIKNLAYSQCIDAPGGVLNVRLQLVNCNGSTTQNWALVVISSTSTYHVNEASGYCAEVNNGTSIAGEAVDEYTCNGMNSERWVQHFDHVITGVTYTEFRHTGTNLCLDTVGGANSQLMQWNCDPTHRNTAQLWLVQ